MPRTNTRQAAEFIAELKPFTTNGALSGEWRGNDYLVLSYTTPIAAVNPDAGTAYLNSARYSVTTSNHQGRAGYGLRDLNPETVTDPAEFTRLTGYHVRQTTR